MAAVLATAIALATMPSNAALLNLSDVSLKFANYSDNDDEFGHGLASGDFNGDGYLDLAAAGPANYSASGRASVFFGQSTGLYFLSLDLDQTDAFESNEAGDRFGDVIAVGDFDGGGIDDVIFAAPGENGSAGAIFQFRGGLDLNLNTTDWPGTYRFSGTIGCGTTEANERFGAALAVGDFNGDGRDDLAIGMPGQNGGSSPSAGAVCVVLGGILGISGGGAIYFQNHPDLPVSGGVVPTRSANDTFGAALAAGDFNGDGFDDLAIGAPFEKTNGDLVKDVGVSVYFGSANNTSATVFPTAIGIVYHRDNSKFGATLAAGDIDADGFDDLIIAAPDGGIGDYVHYPGLLFACSGSASFDVGPYYEVTFGAAGPCSAELNHADLGLVQTGIADRLGTTLGIGHFNGDGAADLFVGDVHGNVFGFPGVPLKSFEDAALVRGGETYDDLAINSAVAKSLAPGDFDGDGTDDLAVGTPRVGTYGNVHVVGGFAPPATSHMPMAFVGYPNASYCGSPPCFGGVDEPYRIGKFEVRNVDYAEFLNAVDPSGANALGLYQPNMFPGIWLAPLNTLGARYVLTPGMWAVPVVGANFINAARMANWLHNGKPTGGVGGTESGAYLLTGGGPYPTNGATVVRQAGADFALPTEREWIKAALHDRDANGMYSYVTGSDTPPSCVVPFEGAVDAANCNQAVGGPIDGGLYPGTTGPYGTVDQGGNVYEWSESPYGGGARYLLGGSYASAPNALNDTSAGSASYLTTNPDLGFRLIALPEPGIGELALAGVAMLSGLRRLRGRRSAS